MLCWAAGRGQSCCPPCYCYHAALNRHAEANAATPVFMAHGDADTVVSLGRAQRTTQGLREGMPRFELKEYPGLGRVRLLVGYPGTQCVLTLGFVSSPGAVGMEGGQAPLRPLPVRPRCPTPTRGPLWGVLLSCCRPALHALVMLGHHGRQEPLPSEPTCLPAAGSLPVSAACLSSLHALTAAPNSLYCCLPLPASYCLACRPSGEPCSAGRPSFLPSAASSSMTWRFQWTPASLQLKYMRSAA